jgi:hypothetical protein
MEVSGQYHVPAGLFQENNPPSTLKITGCVGPKDGLKALGKKDALAHIRTNYPTFNDTIFKPSLSGIFPKAN